MSALALRHTAISTRLALFLNAASWIALLGIQPAGVHSNPNWFGVPIAEWIRLPFGYSLFFGMPTFGFLLGIHGLRTDISKLYAGLAVAVNVGFIAYQWSPYLSLLCHMAGAKPECFT